MAPAERTSRDLDVEKNKAPDESSPSSDSSSANGLDLEKSATHEISAADLSRIETQTKPTSVIGRIISKTQSKLSIDPGPAPDGGFRAWAAVLAVHLITLNTWGYVNSFGVFQTYYENHLPQSSSAISWIGSIQVFLLFGIGTFAGRASDAGYFRLLFVLGTILQTVGTFATSWSHTYWQILLSQGICTGLGNGLMFCPSISVCATYFKKRRAFALSLTASGTAIGGLIIPSMAERLLPRAGYGWTMRAIAFLMLGVQIIAGSLLKQRIRPRIEGPLFEPSAFVHEPPYLFYALGQFLNLWSIYFAFYYVGTFGQDILGADESTCINLLLIMNGVGFVGRLIPGYIADKFLGPVSIMFIMGVLTAVLSFCWMAVDSIPSLFVWSAMYGITASGIQGLFPGGLASLTSDPRKQGTRMGMIFSLESFALLTGCPLGGALLSSNNGSYRGAQIWAGVCMMIGSCFLLAARTAKTGSLYKGRA